MTSAGQFRISKLQVFNWGTFSGVHDIPIAGRGFLFVGRSGTGKTTLLDAISALLVPPKWVDFNAAAREGERRGCDRSLVSYVRGAWAEQQEGDSGLIATQYLRTGTTWSALALTYRSSAGETVVLVQLFWIRGKSNSREDLRRYFLIFDREFDLRELSDFQLDVRRLKLKFPEAFAREDFSPYAERFRRKLGIDTELALKLLHKTQSAKNLGDLNTFLRDFMLDVPETFEAADRLAAEFAELDAAHQAVVTAREQVQILGNARKEHQELQSVLAEERKLQELRGGLDTYKQTLRLALIQKRLVELDAEAAEKKAEEQRRQATLENERASLDDLQRQHRAAGGQQIEDLQKERQRTEELQEGRLRKRGEVQAACRKLVWPLPATPSEFAGMTTAAAREVEAWPEWQEESREKHAVLSTQLAKLQKDFAEAKEEVESLRRQSSNVPARMLQLRARLAGELGIAETALPFTAELIEVLPREEAWRGAVERLLRGFALSLLVEERYYSAVSDLVNRASLGDRLAYNRVAREQSLLPRRTQPNALIHKLQIKDGPFSSYLHSTLMHRFDYACVESMQAFRNAERALTREGQIRHGKDRHEKDDRFDLNDRSRWVLGFDNRAKLALFEQRAIEAARALEECNRNLRELRQSDEQRSHRLLACQTLSNIQWQEIDIAPLADRIGAIDRMLRDLEQGNTVLRELDRRLKAQKKALDKAEQSLIEIKGESEAISRQMRELRTRLGVVSELVHNALVTELQSAELPKYFDRFQQPITLDNLDSLAHEVDRRLTDEQKTQADTRHKLTHSIENHFAEFKRRWPMEAGDLDNNLASAPDYLAKLKRLETDRLPDYEHRFFDLLRNQSYQNLAALSTHISQARKTIFDRLELVNQSLRQAEFGSGTYLQIEASDRNLDEVRDFKLEIQQVLSHAWTDEREPAEERFLILRGIVERLASQESNHRRWRALVLDVRQHVEFIGRELDIEGQQVEVYRGGAAKSGGQRQKLATTCLAAALRYQLGGDEDGLPRYAPVVLDEAFDKADNEFTALVMKIFEKFGFQMIVATPLKSVMTLEPFIGGACFVDITERRQSSVLMIEYDLEPQRLKLPERTHDEISAALS
ncbi:MAG TPA: SbcC/MukB-like Walker B domain-containing protein [Bryobacteraceae bacterium]|nr:SbcC/MukB-like Walker B domain-containing protein [Bryobacteraceae bacterium]